MSKLLRTCALSFLVAGCGDDEATQPSAPLADAGLLMDATQPTGEVKIDAGQSLPDAGGADAQRPPGGKTRPDPNAPPATLNGKKLYTVRFDSRAGDQPFACGKRVPLGSKGTMAEPVDMRFYVHDVTLVRANGERVALTLHQDERYQRENVALLDFADDTGKCLTGDPDIRNLVHGYAPEQADYTGIAFKLGVPADKNHLNAAEAPAPYNVSGMWWSWSLGFKYTKIDLTSDAQPIWFFHAGATDCAGASATGFSCASRQLAGIELPNYDPQASLVVFDAARFYATSDLTVGDDTPGCMSFKGDSQCASLYETLGLTVWDDATPGPKQTAFVLTTGPALVVSKGSTAPDRKSNDPTAWPDLTYQRPTALDVENVSKAGEERSHAPGDPRYGVNCLRCHQEHGPGVGRFSAAGTLLDASGQPARAAKVELFSGDVVGYGQFANVVSHALLEVDAHGNFFTTAALPLDTTELGARIVGPDGKPVLTMPFMQQTAACNNCHTGGMRLTLPAP